MRHRHIGQIYFGPLERSIWCDVCMKPSVCTFTTSVLNPTGVTTGPVVFMCYEHETTASAGQRIYNEVRDHVRTTAA